MNNRFNSDDIDKLVNNITELKETIANISRPPDQVIYDDVDLRNFLKVSKRTTAYWREKGIITFSKLGSKIYYRLSDILNLIKQCETPSTSSNLKIQL